MKAIILFSILTFTFSLDSISQRKIKANEFYTRTKESQTLNSIFPVDDIESITINNYRGSRTLTSTELIFLKEQFKKAKFSGGLMVKPTHIILRIKFKGITSAKAGLLYATTGNIHFDGATDKFGKIFNATYYLPLAINFDNY